MRRTKIDDEKGCLCTKEAGVCKEWKQPVRAYVLDVLDGTFNLEREEWKSRAWEEGQGLG